MSQIYYFNPCCGGNSFGIPNDTSPIIPWSNFTDTIGTQYSVIIRSYSGCVEYSGSSTTRLPIVPIRNGNPIFSAYTCDYCTENIFPCYTPPIVPPKVIVGYSNECGVITILPMTVECNSTNPSSYTASDGEVSLLILGGTAPYEVTWLEYNEITPTLKGLKNGSYTATTVDAYGDYTVTTVCEIDTPQDCSFEVSIEEFILPPTPTPTPTQTPTNTQTPTQTQTPTITKTSNTTPTPTPTQTQTQTPMPTITPTITPTNTQTPTPTNIPCDLTIVSTITTAPTNVGGTNGTATITFTTSNGPSTYSLNNVEQGPCISPLVISNLYSSIEYVVVIKDSNNCTMQSTFTLGETTFSFNADYLMLTYQFTNGLDLDTRTRIVSPNIGQDTQADYVGWALLSQYPTTGNPIIIWGGDNQGLGFESVLIDLNEYKNQYPSDNTIVVDLRAFWYRTVGSNPVNVGGTLWKGGSPIKNGCNPITGGWSCWTNPTADETFIVDSVGTQITETERASGERVATLTYNLQTGSGTFNNNDTTTPSV
jgi:hypothetical protein